MNIGFQEIIWIVMSVVGAGWAILINRFFKLFDDERQFFKTQIDRIDKRIHSVEQDLTEIKVMIGKLATKAKIQ